uniref:Uncharacterized protein n=1 Tax=Trichogramma kaykai TaxID=54128 RepID=A0ABD2WAZ6_9HYME
MRCDKLDEIFTYLSRQICHCTRVSRRTACSLEHAYNPNDTRPIVNSIKPFTGRADRVYSSDVQALPRCIPYVSLSHRARAREINSSKEAYEFQTSLTTKYHNSRLQPTLLD